MRTITKAVECLKAVDPGCCLTVSGLRTLVKRGEIRAVTTGNRQLVNLDELEEYLAITADLEEKPLQSGIRPVPEKVYQMPKKRAVK
jgi:excisionase family DNA binding protein